MICRHCGKEFSDEFGYCPYCAEPKPIERTESQELKEYKSGVASKVAAYSIKCILGCALFFSFFYLLDGLLIAVVLTLTMAVVFATIGVLWYVTRLRPGRERTINMQFSKDQTSICTKCGSHNIKVYRKGYNYNVGFWGAIFGVKGSGYAGGFDANKACCRCMNCGHDWETDYDYRLINK
jgi:hypothetical protein